MARLCNKKILYINKGFLSNFFINIGSLFQIYIYGTLSSAYRSVFREKRISVNHCVSIHFLESEKFKFTQSQSKHN